MTERALAKLLAGPQKNPAQAVLRRFAVVTALAAGPPTTVTLTLNGVSIPGVRYLASYLPAVNDVVLVDFVGSDPVVVGRLDSAGLGPASGVSGSVLAATTVLAAATVTSQGGTGYANVMNAISYTKRYAGSSLIIVGTVSAYFSGTNATIGRFGLQISGTDYDVAAIPVNTLTDHETYGLALQPVAGIAAGAVSIQPRYKAITGVNAPIWNQDANDQIAIQISEVVP